MSTPLTDGINALTAYANEVTGASDTTLSDAVGRLCEGYGGGSELYPVGTDLITVYLGRNANGVGNYTLGTLNTSTGEMTPNADNPSHGLCMTYLPIDPSYSYAKYNGRVYHTFFYDENKSYISGSDFIANNLNWSTINPIPQNAKYMRFATHTVDINWRMTIIRTA